MKSFLKSTLSKAKSKSYSDLIWSGASFAFLAVSGLLLNILITIGAGTAELGIFNITYSIYIISSQLAVLGIHYSVLHYSALDRDNFTDTSTSCFGSACFLALILGFIMFIVLYFFSNYLSSLFNASSLRDTIRYCSFGIVLFPLNKVLMAQMNGLRMIKTFSVVQSIRYLSVLLFVFFVILRLDDPSYASYCFLFSEVCVLMASLIFTRNIDRFNSISFSAKWFVTHLRFGFKGMASGLFAEINTRTDVLIVAAIISPQAAGIYSFIGLLYDGLFHILAIVRINLNPILALATASKPYDKLLSLRKRTSLPLVVVTLGMSIFIVLFFILFSYYDSPELLAGTSSLLILLSSLVIFSPFIPFDNLMIVSGYPLLQTYQQFAAFILNVMVGISLAPHYGLVGAAIGTVCSQIASLTILEMNSRKKLGWSILNPPKP